MSYAGVTWCSVTPIKGENKCRTLQLIACCLCHSLSFYDSVSHCLPLALSLFYSLTPSRSHLLLCSLLLCSLLFSQACQLLASSNIISLLYQLWKEKTDDVEIVLQLIHCFYKYVLALVLSLTVLLWSMKHYDFFDKNFAARIIINFLTLHSLVLYPILSVCLSLSDTLSPSSSRTLSLSLSPVDCFK